jgi:hypothetical protein
MSSLPLQSRSTTSVYRIPLWQKLCTNMQRKSLHRRLSITACVFTTMVRMPLISNTIIPANQLLNLVTTGKYIGFNPISHRKQFSHRSSRYSNCPHLLPSLAPSQLRGNLLPHLRPPRHRHYRHQHHRHPDVFRVLRWHDSTRYPR